MKVEERIDNLIGYCNLMEYPALSTQLSIIKKEIQELITELKLKNEKQ
jgi:hypothetical protein